MHMKCQKRTDESPNYYNYQLRKVRRKFVEKYWRSNFVVVTGNWLRFQWRPVRFDVNGCKACKIAGNHIVTIENKESCLWQHQNLNIKTFHRTFTPPYSTDNHSTFSCMWTRSAIWTISNLPDPWWSSRQIDKNLLTADKTIKSLKLAFF